MLSYVVISEAVRQLRQTLRESQQAFASRLGLYISSVAHYEGGQRSPDYRVTLKLYSVACEADRKDLAEFFLQLINAGIVSKVAVLQNDTERENIEALQSIMYDARFQHLREPLESLLGPVKTQLRQLAQRDKRRRGRAK
jgi:transcriptional regulator with XRE-family HTH domain